MVFAPDGLSLMGRDGLPAAECANRQASLCFELLCGMVLHRQGSARDNRRQAWANEHIQYATADDANTNESWIQYHTTH